MEPLSVIVFKQTLPYLDSIKAVPTITAANAIGTICLFKAEARITNSNNSTLKDKDQSKFCKISSS